MLVSWCNKKSHHLAVEALYISLAGIELNRAVARFAPE